MKPRHKYVCLKPVTNKHDFRSCTTNSSTIIDHRQEHYIIIHNSITLHQFDITLTIQKQFKFNKNVTLRVFDNIYTTIHKKI